MIYNPLNWFWLRDDEMVYSSAKRAVIDQEDSLYVHWVEEGGLATPWPRDINGNQTDAALQEVLAPYGIYVSIATLKVGLKAQIDAAAETERLKYITTGAGQSMTYQQKVDEARAFKATSSPMASDYLVLSSEVGITAETLSDVADIVLAAYAQWQQIGAAIEGIRLGAKRDIDAATDEAAARAIVDAIEWPQPAL